MRAFFLAPAAITALAIALSGCTSVVPSTLVRLSFLDPFTADPAGFAVALETDDGLDLLPDTAVLIFDAVHSPSGKVWHEELPLTEDRSVDGRVTYRISPDGVDRLRVAQAEIIQWKDTSDGNGTLRINVTADGCRVVGAQVQDDPRVSVFMQLAQDAPMRPLVRNGPLLDIFEVDELAELPQCSA